MLPAQWPRGAILEVIGLSAPLSTCTSTTAVLATASLEVQLRPRCEQLAVGDHDGPPVLNSSGRFRIATCLSPVPSAFARPARFASDYAHKRQARPVRRKSDGRFNVFDHLPRSAAEHRNLVERARRGIIGLA